MLFLSCHGAPKRKGKVSVRHIHIKFYVCVFGTMHFSSIYLRYFHSNSVVLQVLRCTLFFWWLVALV